MPIDKVRWQTSENMRSEGVLAKHKRELLGCGLIVIVIVLGLLLVVWGFEYLGIDVPGSREMWIGFIGAVIGGAFTLFGVLITLYKQEETETERKRLENMPIIGFEADYGEEESDSTLTYIDGELITSGFNLYVAKKFVTIKMKVLNNVCAFNYTIVGCAINGKNIPCGSSFAPRIDRIAVGECITFSFDVGDVITTNIFCVVRFSYEDIFGNKYYQEFPFTYFESNMLNEKKTKQIIEIRDIKPPIFVSGDNRTIEETSKEYGDYETFFEKEIK